MRSVLFVGAGWHEGIRASPPADRPCVGPAVGTDPIEHVNVLVGHLHHGVEQSGGVCAIARVVREVNCRPTPTIERSGAPAAEHSTRGSSGTNDLRGGAAGRTRQTDWLANTFFSNRARTPGLFFAERHPGPGAAGHLRSADDHCRPRSHSVRRQPRCRGSSL